MTKNISAMIALGMTIASCGSDPSAATPPNQRNRERKAAPVQSRRTPAPTPTPSEQEGYFLPPEWGGTGQGASAAYINDAMGAQAFAIWLYQHPEALNNLPTQKAITYMYSCGDAATEQENEVRASAIRARYVAKMRAWLSSSKTAQGKAEYGVVLSDYDANRQLFSYRDSANITVRRIKISGGQCFGFIPQTGAPDDMQFRGEVVVDGGQIPPPPMTPAQADRFIQTSAGGSSMGRHINLIVYFTIPEAPAAGARSDEATVRILRADFTNEAGTIYATYQP